MHVHAPLESGSRHATDVFTNSICWGQSFVVLCLGGMHRAVLNVGTVRAAGLRAGASLY
jgi:hypothetical protein